MIRVYHRISRNLEFRSRFDAELDDVEEGCRAGIVKVSGYCCHMFVELADLIVFILFSSLHLRYIRIGLV